MHYDARSGNINILFCIFAVARLVASTSYRFLHFLLLSRAGRVTCGLDIANIRNGSLYVEFASRMFPFLCLQMCNEWAIDTPCPPGGRDFCRSLHILDSRGNSVLASKLSILFSSPLALARYHQHTRAKTRARNCPSPSDFHEFRI